jgi:hypothetical protein
MLTVALFTAATNPKEESDEDFLWLTVCMGSFSDE